MNVIHEIMDQWDTKIDLMKYVSDLYFMVQQFCLISWRLFECRTWYNGSVWHKHLPYKICVGQWPISSSSDFAGYLEDYLMEKCHTCDNGSVWHKHWSHKIYVGQLSIFCGPVSLLNIFKLIWWQNVILEIMDQCDTKIGLIKYI